MTEKEQKNVVESNMNVGVYTIYDCVMKQYDVPFCIQVTKLGDYLSLLVNDVQSKYYNHESDYIVNKIGNFNTDTGEIEQHFVERVSMLDKYVNDNKRNLQTCIQTLNYLPSGYFKMPEEMKKDIQEQINTAVQKYVSDYVIPDLDVNKEKFKLVDKQLHDAEADRNLYEDCYHDVQQYLKSKNLWNDYLEFNHPDTIGCHGVNDWN